MTEPGPESRVAAPDALACPRCGSPVESGQLSCLTCGAGLRFRERRLPGWRLTAITVGLVVLLAGTALGLGAGSLLGEDPPVRASNPDGQPPPIAMPTTTTTTTTPEATTPAPGEGSAAGDPVPEATGGSGGTSGTTTPDDPASSTTTTPGTTTPSATTPTDPGGSGGETLTWPAGESGFTAVLASVPDRADANAAARKARAAGISAGVLRSNAYGSLRAGYWVAFGGRFTSSTEAEEAATRYRAQGFPDAYPREIRP